MASPSGLNAQTADNDIGTVLDLFMGHWKTAMVHALVCFDICDVIANLSEAQGSADAAEVAKQCDTHPQITYRLLRAASCLGLTIQHPNHRFTLTGAGALLTSSHPKSAKSMVLLESGHIHRELWMAFNECLKTGCHATPKVYGFDNYWGIYKKFPEHVNVFTDAMTSISKSLMSVVLDAYSFEGVQTFVDVAGGHGFATFAVLDKYPSIKAKLIDMPEVCQGVTIPPEYEGRVEVASFDLFDGKSYPSGCDVYFLKAIFHDWDDEHCEQILTNLAAVMHPNSKVVVAEACIPPPNKFGIGKLFDLHMFVIANGAERTREEFDTLASKAGLRVSRVVEMPQQWVVEMQLASLLPGK